ncbi:prolyl 3-hydroxylase 3 isoform X1 [Desmodus rotundus]|uniref:prolyl 3-hydroxylase 3 isoform X1 n=1 Tax=Desmodus rotundus TaxID=9430 RepID=UPI0023811CD3|nr:prolyl 3-hydroxylase 3 isoform X1 [Desmodus rotundus]XP_053777832.1 prolyl 3-hydroxylase 3 isoform X1 [Desmodus rotundus]
MLRLFRLLLLLLLLPPPGSPEPPGLATLSPGAPPQAPDLLYADGLRAYSAGAWAPAVALLREALRSYAELGRTRHDCGERCAAELGGALPDAPGPDSRPGPAPGAWERLLLRAALRRAECLSQCVAQRLGPGGAARLRVGSALRDAFRRREPYNYLQRAYYQLKKLDLAAAAAHTFFVANPTHLQMREDMAKYRRMSRVRRQSFRDLETPAHWAAYDLGLELLGRQEAELALPRLEEALQESLAQMERCRAGCEGPEEHQRDEEEEGTGNQAGLYEAIAGHWIQVLQCRQRCVGDMATRPGHSFPVPDFLPSQLRRLHEAHAQVGNLSQAMENVLSVLLFYPEEEAAKEALKQYQAQLGEPRPGLRPREDIQRFVLRSLGEKRQLYYAMEHLGTNFKDPDLWTPEAFIPETLREKLREDQEHRTWDHEPPQPKPLTNWKDVLLMEGVTLTQDARQLNGSERAVLDGLLTTAECGVLLQLAKDAAEAGARSGYRGRRSPHSPHERFEGLTVLKAAQLARAGAVGTQGAKLLLEVSERVRTLTQAYFSPERPLHLSFTHLVCRTAIEGEQEQRMDLSHPVHADNCVLDPDTGECWREPPAYTYRDYSGVLYLNDDFQGGDLFFTEPNALTVRAQVRPRCGRLVAFSSGGENPHGVWAVTRGRRCALALWHTWAPEHREQEWTEAKELLQEPEEEEEEEMPSKDPSPEPLSHRLQRVQDKAGKLPRVREEL